MVKNVLIVEDNPDLRRIVAAFLQAHGYETSEAATGYEAIEMAITEKPNLILLDFDLPDIRGTDVAQSLSKHQRTAHIPIIGCSGCFGTEFREEALRAGMVDYLQKPFSAAGFVTVIKQFIL